MPYKDPAKAAAQTRKWRKANPEKYAAILKNPVNRAKKAEYMRKWRAEHREQHLATSMRSHYKCKYGLTQDRIPNECEVCGSTKVICVDHDHSTGVIRGFLCRACNLILGIADEDFERLRLLAGYLEGRRNDNAKVA